MSTLKRWQNEKLGQEESLSRKFSLLESWLSEGQITSEQYNSYIRKIINRAMKSIKPYVDVNDVCFYRTATEAKLQSFLELLQRKLNHYLDTRDELLAKLSEGHLIMFREYMEEYPYVRSKINRLLIIGLRYPDKRLNKLAEEYILKFKIHDQINQADFAFWIMLWDDGNIVPLNAIRLMLNETENGFELKPCFNGLLKYELKPLIEFQMEKEKIRLQWAESLKDEAKRKIEITRKQRRLDAFECFLKLF